MFCLLIKMAKQGYILYEGIADTFFFYEKALDPKVTVT